MIPIGELASRHIIQVSITNTPRNKGKYVSNAKVLGKAIYHKSFTKVPTTNKNIISEKGFQERLFLRQNNIALYLIARKTHSIVAPIKSERYLILKQTKKH